MVPNPERKNSVKIKFHEEPGYFHYDVPSSRSKRSAVDDSERVKVSREITLLKDGDFMFRGYIYNVNCWPYYTKTLGEVLPAYDSCQTYFDVLYEIPFRRYKLTRRSCGDGMILQEVAGVWSCLPIDKLPRDCHRDMSICPELYFDWFFSHKVDYIPDIKYSKASKTKRSVKVSPPQYIGKNDIRRFNNGSFVFKGYVFDEDCYPLTYKNGKAPLTSDCKFYYADMGRNSIPRLHKCDTDYFDAQEGLCKEEFSKEECLEVVVCS